MKLAAVSGEFKTRCVAINHPGGGGTAKNRVVTGVKSDLYRFCLWKDGDYLSFCGGERSGIQVETLVVI